MLYLGFEPRTSRPPDWRRTNRLRHRRLDVGMEVDHIELPSKNFERYLRASYVATVEFEKAGILAPSQELLLSRWIPTEERNSLVGVTATGVSWGDMASTAICSVVGYHWGWSAIFYTTGNKVTFCFVLLTYSFTPLCKYTARRENR
ncbi:hypothetical protein PR048_002534 [Dryococelus australis]|uniref:Uncharacterized protein n=1 Tax=Dryococelus australis TaxID=614101 RepID=A0ABQ9IMW0_9NEOP|nr:hypothetical protein PR048_002534 [Dryococelus australis]